jgi:hypothetical protein
MARAASLAYIPRGLVDRPYCSFARFEDADHVRRDEGIRQHSGSWVTTLRQKCRVRSIYIDHPFSFNQPYTLNALMPKRHELHASLSLMKAL